MIKVLSSAITGGSGDSNGGTGGGGDVHAVLHRFRGEIFGRIERLEDRIKGSLEKIATKSDRMTKFPDGRTEKFPTDGRKIFGRTDGRKIFGRTDGQKNFGRTVRKFSDGRTDGQ